MGGVVLNFEVQSGDGTITSLSATTNGEGACAIGYTGGQSSTQIHVSDVSGHGTSNNFTFGVDSNNPNYLLSLTAGQNPLEAGHQTTLTAQ